MHNRAGVFRHGCAKTVSAYMTSSQGFSTVAMQTVNLARYNELVVDHAYIYQVCILPIAHPIDLIIKQDVGARALPYQHEIISSFVVDVLSQDVGKIGKGSDTVWQRHRLLFDEPLSLVFITFAATVVCAINRYSQRMYH
jgi:hypothetical protein